MHRAMAAVVGGWCMAVALVGYAQQGQHDATAPALEATPVAYALRLAVAGLPRRGEVL